MASVQPRLHRGGDVDEDVLVLVRRDERDAGGYGRSERRGEVGGDCALGPGAVDVVHIKAASRGDRIDVELEGGLGDVGASVSGGNRRQIELNVSRLRTLDVEQRFGTVVRGWICSISVGIGAGRKLAVGRRTRQQNQT